jgi:fused signal recognition particle receptor
MFEKLRNAFSSAVKSLGEKELKEKDIDKVLFELEIALLEADVATEVIDSIKSDLKKQLIGITVQKDQVAAFVSQNLRQSISTMFDNTSQINIVSEISKKKEKNEPYIILFVGINGTGKTTTIAKVANLLRENKLSSVIAAADTYRAGAIEQITEHAKRLNIKVVAQNYGSDPAAVARDAVLYAKSHKIDSVLIDTAGRMQTSKNLMDQISKINKVVNPDLRLFVGDALAGNDTVSQAREFHNYTKFDGAILTKSDADARGGAAISIVKITSSPILYLGVGQEYKDLKPFDKDVFLESLFGPKEASGEILVKSMEKPEKNIAQNEFLNDDKKEFVTEKEKLVEPEIEVRKAEDLSQTKPLPPSEIPQNVQLENEKDSLAGMDETRRSIDQPLTAKPKPEPKAGPKQEEKQQKVGDIASGEEEDPFAGLSTKDIEKYSDLFDVPPPENDNDAKKLAAKIRQWVLDGRPKPKDTTESIEEEISETEEVKMPEDEKPKKKRSMFGWMKK